MNSYTDFHTEYSFDTIENGEFKSSLEKAVRACFANLFNKYRSKGDELVEGRVIFYLYRPDKEGQRILANNCILSLQQIELYLNELKKLFSFEYEVEVLNESLFSDKNYNKSKAYASVTVIVNEKSHKFITLLTMFRYLYEHKYNYVLSDALKLYELRALPIYHHSLYNYLHITSYATGNYGSGHSYCGYGFCKLKNIDRIKERLDKVQTSVNNHFELVNDDGLFSAIKKEMQTLMNDITMNAKNSYIYADEELFFKKRLPLYQKFIEEIYKRKEYYETN